MSEFDVLRLLGEALGVIGIAWRLASVIVREIRGVHARLDTMNGSVAELVLADQRHDQMTATLLLADRKHDERGARHDLEIAQMQAWVQGRTGEPLEPRRERDVE